MALRSQHSAAGRTLRRLATATAVLAVPALAACAARRGSLPRQLVRLGPAPAVTGTLGAARCAQRLRDPATGREYQLRVVQGDGTRVAAGTSGGPGAFPAALVAEGLYVVATSDGGASQPLRVDCASLRVLGVAPR